MAELVATSEERIAYLRERGVEIEFPEDRHCSVSSAAGASGHDTVEIKVVKVIKVPCNLAEPLSELQIPVSRGNGGGAGAGAKGGDQLLTILRVFFKSKTYEAAAVVDGLRKTSPTLLSSGEGGTLAVSDNTLRDLAQQGNVETFVLSRPTPATGYCGVAFYLDEVGQLKQLPRNQRAVSIAAQCGFDNVPLVGDIFVARTRIVPEPTSSSSSPSSSSSFTSSKFEHLDFGLDDLDSSAAWLKKAKADNYDAAAAVGRVSLEGGGESAAGWPHGTAADGSGRPYTWRETPDGVSMELVVPLPPGTAAKDVAVTFRARSLAVKTKRDGAVLLQIDELAQAVEPDDCTWTLTGDGGIDISLLKCDAGEKWGNLEKLS